MSTPTPPRESPANTDRRGPAAPWWPKAAAGVVLAAAILGLGVWLVEGRGLNPGMAGSGDGSMAGSGDGSMTGSAGQGMGDAGQEGTADKDAMASRGMESMEGPDAPDLPPVFGYYEGSGIAFVHPSASSREVASLLTEMMGSPVLTVPALADVPDEARSDLYVFTNGVEPDGFRGPFGFQPDVFAHAPVDDEYSPLVEVVTVTWDDEEEARELTSLSQIRDAEDAGEVTVERTGDVVNAPMLTWPGGR